MNAKHPIDELFAHALRDAEATPPPAVWEGIVRERGWAHRTLLKLQRNWGLSAFVLLLIGGVAGYATWTSARNNEPRSLAQHTIPDPAARTNDVVGSATGPKTTTPSEKTSSSEVAPTTMTTTVGTTPTNAAACITPAAETGRSGTLAPKTTTIASRKGSGSEIDLMTPGNSASKQAGASRPSTIVHADASIIRPSTSGDRNTSSGMSIRGSTPNRSTASNDPDEVRATAPVDAQPARDADNRAITTSTMAEIFTTRLSTRNSLLTTAILAEPLMMPGRTVEPYVAPKGDWWVGMTSASYEERRTWKGDDEVLVDALNLAETPHYPWSIGIAGGYTWRDGFGLNTGVNVLGSRSTFSHEDHLVQQTFSTQTYVITLDNQVFYSEPVTTVSTHEETRLSKSRNSFTALMVPFEGSKNWSWRRWSLGARLGIMAEIVNKRSGLTLERVENTDGSGVTTTGVQAVDMSQPDLDPRFRASLSGTFGLDVGYQLCERWGIWWSPRYDRGLATMGGGGAPHAVPERLGLVDIRIAYTLPHHR